MVAKLLQKVVLIGLVPLMLLMNGAIAQAREVGAGVGYSLSEDVSYCSGYLDAEDSKSRINLRKGPGTNYAIAHYGLRGDKVDFLNRDGDPKELMVEDDTNDVRWYQVGFRESGAYGWVRRDFVRQDECRG